MNVNNNNFNSNSHDIHSNQSSIHTSSEPQLITNAFAMIVPGHELNTNCYQIRANNNTNNNPTSDTKYLMMIENPGLVQNFAISLLNANQLPSDLGFAIFYSLPPFNDWKYIGIIHCKNASKIFKCPWMDIKGITKCPIARIGFELRAMDFLQSLEKENEKVMNETTNVLTVIKNEFAIKVANNLYEWMTSYTKSTENGEYIIAPANCLNQWQERFHRKYILDPEFMKTG